MTAASLDFGASNATRYYDLTGPALPNGDWCIGFWTRRDRTSGVGAYFSMLSIGDVANFGSDFISIFGGADDFVGASAVKDSGGAGPAVGPVFGAYVHDALNYLVIVQRRGANLEIYTVAKGVTASSPNDTTAHGMTAGVSSQTWYIGCRNDLANWHTNPLGEVFCLVSDSLSAAEITTLAAGTHIATVRPTRALDLRLRTTSSTETDLSGNGHTATQHGTGWATTTEFFPDSVNATGSGATTEASPDTAAGTGSSTTTGSGASVPSAGPDVVGSAGTVTQPTSADVNGLSAKTTLSGTELLALSSAGVAFSVTPAVLMSLVYAGSGTVSALGSVSKATFRIAYATDGRRSGQGLGAGTGCPVWADGSNWRTFYDNSVVAA